MECVSIGMFQKISTKFLVLSFGPKNTVEKVSDTIELTRWGWVSLCGIVRVCYIQKIINFEKVLLTGEQTQF